MAEANGSHRLRTVSRSEIMQCSFPVWYYQFEKVTPLSFITPLPADFVEYLLSDDTLRLPGKPYQWNRKTQKDNSQEDNDSDVSWSDVEDDDELGEGATDVPAFEKLSRWVSKKIRKLGGRCFPKLDWSCPKDASWIGLNNSLSCSTFVDVCLLLKSSSFVIHDLTNPFEYCDDTIPLDTACHETVAENIIGGEAASCIPHHLVLRKWVEIEPSFEFRCFVHHRELTAISQREISQYYGYIIEQRDQIVNDVMSFFKEYIQDRFPLENYTFDVYRSRKDYVRLLDFNPFCAQTDGLLFDWNELYKLKADNDQPEFRYHTDGVSLRPGSYRQYSLPDDVLHFSNGSSAEKLVDLMRIHDVQKPKKSENLPKRVAKKSTGKNSTESGTAKDRTYSSSSATSSGSKN
ncbi:cell division cycle protein 123 homolog [Varroa destructor]|uniref:Cell division cycle protein 123 homolog n=1 Tax=Varroa destructor TaxID=109461 RepID=A0A7M7KT22_VARDE|nr:cell division cycle protein 123 homolog [Varroa destructor]